MSTNATAAIAGPTGGGKAGGGCSGVSDSQAVARRCVFTLARGRGTSFSASIPVSGSRSPRSFLPQSLPTTTGCRASSCRSWCVISSSQTLRVARGRSQDFATGGISSNPRRLRPRDAPARAPPTPNPPLPSPWLLNPRFVPPLRLPQTSADAGISAFPDGDNIFNWVGTIEGAVGTVRGPRTRAHLAS